MMKSGVDSAEVKSAGVNENHCVRPTKADVAGNVGNYLCYNDLHFSVGIYIYLLKLGCIYLPENECTCTLSPTVPTVNRCKKYLVSSLQCRNSLV